MEEPAVAGILACGPQFSPGMSAFSMIRSRLTGRAKASKATQGRRQKDEGRMQKRRAKPTKDRCSPGASQVQATS
jgi:hypothetical protein